MSILFFFQKSCRASCRGITLVEVLVATAILAGVLCAIVGAFISCAALISIARNTNTAANAAASFMEEIRASSFVNLVDNYDQVTFVLNDIPESRGAVFVDDSNSELVKVTITLSWRQGNRIIGGDTNLNGRLDTGERADADGILESPVKLVTLISNG